MRIDCTRELLTGPNGPTIRPHPLSLALLAAVLIGAASIARPGAVLREHKRYKIDFMSKQHASLLAVQELTKMTTVGQKVATLNDKRLLICLISLNPYHLFHEFLR